MSDQDDAEVERGAGINGEVYPCPKCGRHETVKFISGDEYRYVCIDCDIEYGIEEAKGR